MPLPPASFDAHLRTVDLNKIVPLRAITTNMRASRKYRAIASSMEELGMVEPLVIHPLPRPHHVPLIGWAPAIGYSPGTRHRHGALPCRHG